MPARTEHPPGPGQSPALGHTPGPGHESRSGPQAGFGIEHCLEIDSTNAELLRRAVLPDRPLWLVAERQTAGRGRRARPWRSAVGDSMTASLALECVRPRNIGPLALVAGVAVAEALDTFGVRVLLKWPNDVYVPVGTDAGGFAKAGGILCEARARGESTRLVIGVGLNLRAPPAEGLGQPIGGLFDRPAPEAFRPVPSVRAVAAAVGQALATAVRGLLDDGFAPCMPRWRARDLLHGRAIVVHPAVDGAAWPGRAAGIDDDGALLVMRDGATDPVRLLAGEVSIRLQAPDGAADGQ